MNPPFTADQFFEVFARYNAGVWPMQVIFLVVGASLVALAARGGSPRGRIISVALALVWTWMALVYHLYFFRAINAAAGAFALIFLAQAALFLWLGLRHEALTYEFHAGPRGYFGGFLLAYGLLVYPVIGLMSGRAYASQPSFGLPCPTTIFTLGMLLWAKPRVPWPLLVVPAAWSLIGFTAVTEFGVYEDMMMPIGVLVGSALILRGQARATPPVRA